MHLQALSLSIASGNGMAWFIFEVSVVLLQHKSINRISLPVLQGCIVTDCTGSLAATVKLSEVGKSCVHVAN
jgi:hypothetical protein